VVMVVVEGDGNDYGVAGCRSSEFSCLNGYCVPRSRCQDSRNDCHDNTDETICGTDVHSKHTSSLDYDQD